jgi:hypothetical protein
MLHISVELLTSEGCPLFEEFCFSPKDSGIGINPTNKGGIYQMLLKQPEIIPLLDEHLAHYSYIERLWSQCSFLFKKSFSENENHPISKIIRRIIKYHKEGRYHERNTEELRLEMLMKHLKNIRTHDLTLFNKLRSEFEKRMSDIGSWGIRFEIRVCSELINANIHFIKRESPDFEIKYNKEVSWIECTSIRKTSSKRVPSLIESIRSKFNDKARKPYCNTKTALFIEITNVLQKIGRIRNFSITENLESIKNEIPSLFNNNNFGAVFLCFSIYDPNKGIFHNGRIRIFNPSIDASLKTFLYVTYPPQPRYVESFLIPIEG